MKKDYKGSKKGVGLHVTKLVSLGKGEKLISKSSKGFGLFKKRMKA